MEYDVLVEISRDKLIDAVNQRIKEGWKPLGGVAVTFGHGNGWRYSQAVTKEGDR